MTECYKTLDKTTGRAAVAHFFLNWIAITTDENLFFMSKGNKFQLPISQEHQMQRDIKLGWDKDRDCCIILLKVGTVT